MSNSEYIHSLILYLTQGAGALILAIILYRFYISYRHKYLKSWCLSWIGFGIYLIGIAISYSLIEVIPPDNGIRIFITLIGLFFGYFQLVFLTKGTYEVATKGAVKNRIVVLSLILVLVASLVFVFVNIQDPNALGRILTRAGFRSLISGVSFMVAAFMIYRSTMIHRGLGVKLVFWMFLIYGLQQFHYAIAIIMGYMGNHTLFGFTIYLGVADLLIQSLMGVGMIVWLLEDESRELKKANKDLDSLVYSTSHDLRAPLASVLGLLNVARLEKDQSKVSEYFGMIEERIKKLDSIISDIMVFSQNNKGALRIRKINIRTAINETVEDLKFSEGFNSIKVEVDIKPDFEFQTDQERFKIILNNLISNSIKYRGRNEPFIRISAHIARENLILEIEDNGIGIEEAHIGRIFEMFYRASENTGGSGLGLYIVQEAILRLGGTIKVTSVPMKGTKFTLELSALK